MAGDFENTGGKAKVPHLKKRHLKAVTADGSEKSAKSTNLRQVIARDC